MTHVQLVDEATGRVDAGTLKQLPDSERAQLDR
jgi:hypothetical protein